MVEKRKAHHWLVVVKQVKTWQLIMALVLLVGLSAYLLRQNNLGMVERRNAVKQADESNGDTQAALTELQRYVAAHMNTDLGEGVFLDHTYQRAYDKEVQQAAASVSTNSQAYKDTEAACRNQYTRGGSFSAYIKCVQDGLKSLSPGSDPLASVKVPPAELFKFNFVSPVLSLDLAGLAVLATLLVGLLLVIRIMLYMALKAVLKLRSRN